MNLSEVNSPGFGRGHKLDLPAELLSDCGIGSSTWVSPVFTVRVVMHVKYYLTKLQSY